MYNSIDNTNATIKTKLMVILKKFKKSGDKKDNWGKLQFSEKRVKLNDSHSE